jgi:hypothetical protein
MEQSVRFKPAPRSWSRHQSRNTAGLHCCNLRWWSAKRSTRVAPSVAILRVSPCSMSYSTLLGETPKLTSEIQLCQTRS